MGNQTMRQAPRLAASQVQTKRRGQRAERDRRLERLAMEVLPRSANEMPPQPPVPGCLALKRGRRIPSEKWETQPQRVASSSVQIPRL